MTDCPRQRGRPKQLGPEARETAILDAVERVMARAGLNGTTMASIAREAGMSKRTLYDTFDNRAALVAACIRRIRTSAITPLRPDQWGLPLAARLQLMLTPDLHYLASCVPLILLRAVIAEAPRQPDLALSFRTEGPRAARTLIAHELNRAVANGEIKAVDTDAAAGLLHDMVYGHLLERLMDPAPAASSLAQTQARLAFSIDVFLHGLAHQHND